jgi:hypothetical protein
LGYGYLNFLDAETVIPDPMSIEVYEDVVCGVFFLETDETSRCMGL